jgi:hypothetical protein
MAYENLKAAIEKVIKTNSNQEITGQILQDVLKNIVSNLGVNATYAGIAIPTTNPGIPDGQVFYIASEPGNYINFSNLSTIEADNKIHIIYNDINSNDWLEEALDLEEFVPVLKVLILIGSTVASVGTDNRAESEDAMLSLAIGKDNIIGNSYCLASGNGNKATGFASHAEGSRSIATGTNSHAEGNNTAALNGNTHAEGDSCKASGNVSHAEGYNCVASGSASHAEGNNTIAAGANSHAGGISTQVNADNSFAHGNNIIVKTANTVGVGTYNFYEFSESVEPRFMIGIGTSNETRRNALVILANGNIFIKGIGGYEGLNITGNMKPLQDIIQV